MAAGTLAGGAVIIVGVSLTIAAALFIAGGLGAEGLLPRLSFKRRPLRGQRQYEVDCKHQSPQTVWANDAGHAVEQVNRFQTSATARVVSTGEYVFLTRKHISAPWTL